MSRARKRGTRWSYRIFRCTRDALGSGLTAFAFEVSTSWVAGSGFGWKCHGCGYISCQSSLQRSEHFRRRLRDARSSREVMLGRRASQCACADLCCQRIIAWNSITVPRGSRARPNCFELVAKTATLLGSKNSVCAEERWKR